MASSIPRLMPVTPSRFWRTSLTVFFLATASLCRAALFGGDEWRPITPEEKAISGPVVDPNAGAEILFEEINVDDSNELSDRMRVNEYGDSVSFCIIRYYRRVKIFDERGVEQVKQFYHETPRSTSLKGLTARVIQADGSVTVLDNADLITSDNFRDGDELRKRYRFPIPDLRPGVIVDIKWKESFKGLADNRLFILGSHLPIRTSRLNFKHRDKYICFFNTHNVPDGMKEGNYGVWSAEVQNVPIVPDELYLPPRLDIQPWVGVFYAPNTNYVQRDEFWKYVSKALDKLLRFDGKSGDSTISGKTAELTRGITDPKEKLRVLYEFCMREIANLDYRNSGYSEADIKEIDDDKEWGDVQDSAETLKTGRGHSWAISILFAAMAQSAGFETQIALCNDRSYLEWDINCLTDRMVPDMIVAIKNGDKWDYYQPGAPYMPFGMLGGGNEGTIAVLSNTDKGEFGLTPTAPSTDSVLSRTGTFTIDADGTLQGNAVFHYSGHKANSAKNAFAGMTLEARTDQFEDEVRASVPGAEISELQFDNIDDPCKDLEIRFKMTVHGFADVTGERLLFQPSIFEKGSTPVFTTETRSYDIRFPYAWEERDKLKITYPDSFEIEQNDAPKSIIDTPALAYVVQLGRAKSRPTLVYSRLQKINVLNLPVKQYDNIKTIFEAINTEDHHVITLRRKSEPVPGGNATAAPVANP